MRPYGAYANGVRFSIPDITSCKVTEERNGAYKLELSYPVYATNWLELDIGNIVYCKPNPYMQPQAFVITSVSAPMNGSIKVNADHISYQLTGVMVSRFVASTAAAFRLRLMEKAVGLDSRVSFASNVVKSISPAYNGEISAPRNFRDLLIGKTDSFVSLFGGEVEFDNYAVTVNAARGADNGVKISYGKNLLALTKTRTARDFATGVYPFYLKKEQDTVIYRELPEKVLNFEMAEYSDVIKTIPLDLTSSFDTTPSESELRAAAIAWINLNWQEAPPFNLKISFVDLSKTTEYASVAAAETVKLCDIITVSHPGMSVSSKLKVVKTVYNVLTDRYDSIEVGDPLPTLADTILKISGR